METVVNIFTDILKSPFIMSFNKTLPTFDPLTGHGFVRYNTKVPGSSACINLRVEADAAFCRDFCFA